MSKREWNWNCLDSTNRLIDHLQPYTKSSVERLQMMFNCLRTIDDKNIDGDIVECGVWRGGNIMMARIVCPKRLCWLYDTFDGMTEPHPEFDVKRSGEKAIDRYNLKKLGGTKWDAVSMEDAQANFREHQLMDNTIWVKGPIENTAFSHYGPDKISLLRLDMDWHGPTKIALEVFFPLLEPSGFLIIDDYGHWMGCQKAVNDYFGENKPEMIQVDYSCVVIRKC